MTFLFLAVAQYGTPAELRRKPLKTRSNRNRTEGMIIKTPAAVALFGGIALLAVVITGLLVIIIQKRTWKYNKSGGSTFPGSVHSVHLTT